MSDFDYEVGGSLFGFPIIAVNNPDVTIRLPLNITVTANLSQGPADLGKLLSQGAAYTPPPPPSPI